CRAARRRHVSALLDKFVELQDVDADTRLQELRKFAAAQTPDLITLEAEAERLRQDLVGSEFGKSVDWNAQRRWKLGALKTNVGWAEKEADFQVVRAAIY